MKTTNSVFFIRLPNYADIFSAISILRYNKKLLDKKLFNLCLTGSWNCVNIDDKNYIIINIIYFDYVKLRRNMLNEVISVFTNLAKPDYSHYLNIMKLQSVDALQSSLLEKIGIVSAPPIDEVSFELLFNFIRNQKTENLLLQPEIRTCKKNEFKISSSERIDYHKFDALSFVGNIFYVMDNSNFSRIEELFLFKILTKYIGDNDTGSLYFPLREKGDIYSAVSIYQPEYNCFFTGVICNYSNDLFKTIENITKNCFNNEIIQKRFENARRSLLYEVLYLDELLGSSYTSLEFCRVMPQKQTTEDITKYIDHCSFDLFNTFVNALFSLEMVVSL